MLVSKDWISDRDGCLRRSTAGRDTFGFRSSCCAGATNGRCRYKLNQRCDATMSGVGVRRDKAVLSSGCKSHPATAPAGSNRSSHGGNEVAEAFG